MSELEQILPVEKREALRAAWLAETRWYSPWLHLGVTSGVGVGAMVLAVALMGPLAWWHVLFAVLLFVACNATEWRLHKGLLHNRVKPFHFFYDRHTPQHHMVFLTDDMELRSRDEFRLVLLPSWAIVLLFFSLLPAAALIWFGVPFRLLPEADQHNLAALFLFVTMFYVVTYEWLHLAHHLPASHPVAKVGVFQALKRHHAIHHDPRLMRSANFNVNLPLWDLVRGTVVRDREQALAPKTAP
jgi:hypothetical protein